MSSIHWRKRKRVHMMMWAMLTLPIRQDWSWRYLLEWARLGGKPEEAPAGKTIPATGMADQTKGKKS